MQRPVQRLFVFAAAGPGVLMRRLLSVTDYGWRRAECRLYCVRTPLSRRA